MTTNESCLFIILNITQKKKFLKHKEIADMSLIRSALLEARFYTARNE